MTRQQFLTAMVAVLSATLPAAAQQRESDAVAFVRRLYQREILRDVRGGKMSEAEFHGLFTAALRALLQSPVPPRPNAPAGPILHAFYGPGVLPGWEVTLQNVAGAEPQNVQGTSVAVDIAIRGVPRQILVHTAREAGRLRIADIDYGTGESYVAYHRRLRGQ